MSKTKIILVLAIAAAPLAAQRAPVTLPPKPEAAPAKPFVYPTVTYDSLANGLRYAVVENHELPLVVVQTAFRGTGPMGVSQIDTPDKPGAWGLLLATLREGTATRQGAQLTDEIADLGTDMRFTAAPSFTPPSFRAARSTWTASLDLLGDVLANPAFPAAGVARVQASMATNLDRLDPLSTAQRVLYTNLYGPDSPNARFATGASIRALTRDDLVAMQRQYLRPQNTMMVVAGDVTAQDVRAALTKALGAWSRGGTTVAPPTITAPAAGPTTIYLKDSPGLAQSMVLAGQLLPGRESPDAASIDALSSLLGDFSVSTGSRVYNAFRIERGLSYSARVQLFTRPVSEPSALVTTLAVTPTTTDTAVTVLLRVLRDLRQDKPATTSELDFSKRNLVGRLPVDMERVDLMAARVLQTMNDRLPPDFLNTWIGKINALGLPEVQAAAARYLDPDRVVVAVVGDRSKVEPALRATGLPVVIVDK